MIIKYKKEPRRSIMREPSKPWDIKTMEIIWVTLSYRTIYMKSGAKKPRITYYICKITYYICVATESETVILSLFIYFLSRLGMVLEMTTLRSRPGPSLRVGCLTMVLKSNSQKNIKYQQNSKHCVPGINTKNFVYSNSLNPPITYELLFAFYR